MRRYREGRAVVARVEELESILSTYCANYATYGNRGSYGSRGVIILEDVARVVISPMATAPAWECGHCGSMLSEDVFKCPNCGAPRKREVKWT